MIIGHHSSVAPDFAILNLIFSDGPVASNDLQSENRNSITTPPNKGTGAFPATPRISSGFAHFSSAFIGCFLSLRAIPASL